MEAMTIFAGTVGLIGTIHLLSTVAERIGQGRYSKGNQEAKREDWYCFFQPSDLLGEDWQKTEKSNTQPTLSDQERTEQQRRQQANRPRLHA